MKGVSQEYIGAVVLILMSILKALHIELPSDVLTGLVTGVVALWIAYNRYKKGDIKLSGVRK